MTGVRRTEWAGILDLHPHRLWLLLTAILSAAVVQVMIAIAATISPLELVLFAVALLLLLDATGVGANVLTVSTAVGWIWAGTRGVDGYTLIVALALLMTHACLTLAGHGHPQAPLDPEMTTRWAVRTAVVAALTVLTWLAAWTLSHQRWPATDVLAVAALVLVAAALLWLRAELTRAAPPD